jgi:hypothetical protein
LFQAKSGTVRSQSYRFFDREGREVQRSDRESADYIDSVRCILPILVDDLLPSQVPNGTVDMPEDNAGVNHHSHSSRSDDQICRPQVHKCGINCLPVSSNIFVRKEGKVSVRHDAEDYD